MKCEICGTTGSELCNNCYFWIQKSRRNDPNTVVCLNHRRELMVDYIGPKNAHDKGCCGRKFEITFTDGRIVETDNLWCNGTPPQALLHLFPVNAEVKCIDPVVSMF